MNATRAISPARYLAMASLVAVVLSSFLAVLNWAIDPLQFYRRAAYPPQFSTQARYQNPGLAKHYPYDCALLGTSVSLGFDLVEVDRALRGHSICLAMQGASAREQRELADVALHSGKPRRIVWDVNYEFVRGTADWVSDFDGTFPSYLYDSNALNEIPNYLLNIDTTKMSLHVILERFALLHHPPVDLATLNQLDASRRPGRAELEQAWRRARSGRSFFKNHGVEFDQPQPSVSFDDNFLAPIRTHPEVSFELWFPPHSIAYFELMREFSPSAFDGMFAWKRHIFSRLRLLTNVRLHDFQGDARIVLDPTRYIDTVHFDRRTHSEIIEAIASGSHLVSDESLTETERLLRQEATPNWLTRH